MLFHPSPAGRNSTLRRVGAGLWLGIEVCRQRSVGPAGQEEVPNGGVTNIWFTCQAAPGNQSIDEILKHALLEEMFSEGIDVVAHVRWQLLDGCIFVVAMSCDAHRGHESTWGRNRKSGSAQHDKSSTIQAVKEPGTRVLWDWQLTPPNYRAPAAIPLTQLGSSKLGHDRCPRLALSRYGSSTETSHVRARGT